jgi:hypothetical protein
VVWAWERVSSGGLTVEPGVRAIIGADVELMRGRLFYPQAITNP